MEIPEETKKMTTEVKSAAMITPQEILNFSTRIQTQLPSNPNTPNAVSALNTLANSLSPGQPPSRYTYGFLSPLFNIREFSWRDWTGVDRFEKTFGAWRPPYNTDPYGSEGFYPKTKYLPDRQTVERADVIAVRFVGPPAGSSGVVFRTAMAMSGLMGITDKRGQFIKHVAWTGNQGAFSWTTDPNANPSNKVILVPGRDYWLMGSGIKRIPYFDGTIEGSDKPRETGPLTTSTVISFRQQTNT